MTDEPTPQNAARQRLANARAEAQRARAAQTQAWRLYSVLDGLTRAAAAADEELAELRRLDDEALAAFLAGDQTGPAPEPAPALAAAEARAAREHRYARAAAQALERDNPARDAATARLTRAESVLATAIFGVAVEEGEALARAFAAMLTAALAISAEIEALRQAVVAYAAGKPAEMVGAAASAAGRLLAMNEAARTSASAAPDVARARRFLNDLRENSEVTLR